jgi:hypothetical protein
MPGLDPGIHAVSIRQVETPMECIAGPSPAEAGVFSVREWLRPAQARQARQCVVYCDSQNCGSAGVSLPPILIGAMARARPVASSMSMPTPEMVAGPSAG